MMLMEFMKSDGTVVVCGEWHNSIHHFLLTNPFIPFLPSEYVPLLIPSLSSMLLTFLDFLDFFSFLDFLDFLDFLAFLSPLTFLALQLLT